MNCSLFLKTLRAFTVFSLTSLVIACGQKYTQKSEISTTPNTIDTITSNNEKTDPQQKTTTLPSSSSMIHRDTTSQVIISSDQHPREDSKKSVKSKPKSLKKKSGQSIYKYKKKSKDYKPYRPPSKSKYKSGPLPHFVLQEEVFHFDTVVAGEVVQHRFFFSNMGKAPLIFRNGYSTCGCTNPTFPKEPVKPGQASYVYISFNTRGKSGDQDAKVYFQTNESNREIVLHLKGYVKDKK